MASDASDGLPGAQRPPVIIDDEKEQDSYI